MAKPIIDGFCNILGIHSPSTLFEGFGVNIVQGLVNGLSNIWNAVQFVFTNLVARIVEKFAEIKINIENWGRNTKETIKNWTNNIKTKISECWGNVSNIVNSNISNIKTNISTGLNKIKSTINTWGEKVKTSFSGLGSKASTWGKDLVTNMSNGIKNNIGKVTNAVNSVASKIKGLLGFSEPEEGPLSNFHTYMPDMIDLMVQGIHSNISKVTKELENLTGTMSYTINTPDIAPLSIRTDNVSTKTIQPRNIMAETLSDVLSDHEWNSNNNDKPIQIAIYVGSKKIGDILLDDLRDKKRQTGKDIEALIGG